MDTKGVIREHSKIKLELYRLYLERYLSVLSVVPFVRRIDIVDPFAGRGFSDGGETGSAIIAAETISNMDTRSTKPISLQLNDADPENCNNLRKNLEQYQFASVECGDADTFIRNWSPTGHSLFFIDPHGYTQISPENLSRIFDTERCDSLIFIPIHHIYRFLKPAGGGKSDADTDGGLFSEPEGTEKRRHTDSNNYFRPITQFLNSLGIDQNKARQASSVEAFADTITEALKNIACSEFVYCQMLENKEKNNKYSLFFISHNILGAEKFLEARYKLRQHIASSHAQQSFDFVSSPDSDPIWEFVKSNTPYDNVKLYELGIKHGIYPTELKNRIKEMEKNGQVEIEELKGKKRQRGGLYIDYTHYKDEECIISLVFRS